MSEIEIANRVNWILNINFQSKPEISLSTANLIDDLGLNCWEINLFLYYIEQSFNIKLKPGLEKEISSLSEIVNKVLEEINKETRQLAVAS